MMTIPVELSEGKHTIRVSKDGYDTLTAEINVGSSSVSCVSVNGVTPGRCGQSTGPGVVASGWNVTVSLKEATTADICSWITGKGGCDALAAFDIMTLVKGYIGKESLGFTVTASHISGAVAYYLGQKASGNTLTGCNF